MILSAQQIHKLRQQAHALKPVVWLGQHGLTEAVLEEINIALEAHELIKVKLAGADREVRDAWAQEIVKSLSAIIVQQIGQICVFYREKEDKK